MKKYQIRQIWKVSSQADPKQKFEQIFNDIAKIIYYDVDNMNSWNSNLVITKNSLLKDKPSINSHLSEKDISGTPSFHEKKSCCS